MTSGNCQKGLVAGEAFSNIFPDVVVLSASACKENHWATEVMVSAVDAALDSVARRRRGFVEEVSLVGVSDGSLGVLVYSMYGKRRVKNRLLLSSYGKLLGEAPAVAAFPKMNSGRWRFLQGGADRLYPPSETIPWIQDFCKNVGADCDLRYDPSGEHDWSYWQGHHLDWIREAFPFKK
jgi:pimeloyl-ACP methyl ester carboxylesterase